MSKRWLQRAGVCIIVFMCALLAVAVPVRATTIYNESEIRGVMEQAFENGAEKVWVDPNPNNEKALALYKRLGFVQKPRPEYLAEDENIASVYMEKQK